MLRIAIVLGLLLIPGLALADELELGLGSSVEYDSNVYRSRSNEQQDAIFRILPEASLYRDRGDLQYRLSYAVPFEQGVETADNISDFDHVANAESSWIYDEATEFFFSDRFRYDRSVTRRYAEEDDTADISNRRARVLTNTATLGMNHAVSPRTTTGVTFSHSLFDTRERQRQDNQTFALTTDVNYAVTTRNQLGTGFSFTFQDFERSGGLPESQTYYYNLFGSWVFRFDETTSFSIIAGPTLIQIDEQAFPDSRTVDTTPMVGGQAFDFSTCGTVTDPLDPMGTVPVLAGCKLLDPQPPSFTPGATLVGFAPGASPRSDEELRITAFGRAVFSKRWTPSLVSVLSYRRQQSAASGLGGSTVLDAVTAGTDWQIDRWWDASIRFDFAHRESIGKSTQTFLIVEEGPNGEAIARQTAPGLTFARVKNSIDTDNIGVAGRLARQIGRRAEASLRISYNKQFSDRGTRGRVSDYDVILAIFGFRYLFEPITVW